MQPSPQTAAQNNIDDAPLWQPSQEQIEGSLLHDFLKKVEAKTGQSFASYQKLQNWSVENLEDFWSECWDFCEIIGDKGATVLKQAPKMQDSRFFPESSLNYAENVLRRNDDGLAMIFRNEKPEERTLTYSDVHTQVSLWQQALLTAGISKGDRIAGYLPNMPETIIAMLAANSIGAVWASASPDFGVQGVLDRFGQIEPKILISVNGYYYNGKTIDCIEKLKEIQPQLPSLEKTILIDFLGSGIETGALEDTYAEKAFLEPYAPQDVQYTRLEFDHPLFIMFSSGTTGKPKCIVHGQGGTLLQHMKEHKLQSDVKRDDKLFYFTTCGWMMWNWLATGLASEACLMLFDGSPFYPDGYMLWDFAEKHGCTFFGTSAKYIDALKAGELEPGKHHNLKDLRAIGSTGSPLVHESFDYVYASIKKDVHLSSLSGGTDIVSCFMLGNPISSVYRGELQGAGLGMAVNVFDEDGAPTTGNSGELVCTKPFPCMPVMFWNDEGGERYNGAYFDRFENIWCHGDWVEKTTHEGFIIHGRSDATLNPGGVRIGTAEIYRQVEQIPAIFESIAVGQDWEGDVRVILFVRLKEGETLTEELIIDIKTRIRSGASPRHVPAKVIAVSDIPRTKSGKITELAVRDVIMGRPIKNKEALANPEALELYKDLEDLRS